MQETLRAFSLLVMNFDKMWCSLFGQFPLHVFPFQLVIEEAIKKPAKVKLDGKALFALF
jgi:hypothetical protein